MKLLIIAILITLTKSQDDFLYDDFPETFMFGLATAAYQIEGSPHADGKGLTNWDYWAHNGTFEGHCNVNDCENGDMGPNSYVKFKEDSALLRDMGASFYRFSISWARIVPTGRVADGVNQAGIDHYHQVIDDLLENNIQPFITLYHWDEPLPLVWSGSWLNDAIVDHFNDYARIVFSEYAGKVKFWLSFNEPHVFCPSDWTYGYPQPFSNPPVKPYICAHNVIKAHALAYRLFDSQFRQGGQMGITLNVDWPEPLNGSDSTHNDASDRSMHFHYGWWANALVNGEYPAIMRQIIDAKSVNEGRNESRLPSFDTEWTRIINGSLDFLGVNHYFSYYVSPLDWSTVDNSSIWLNEDADIKVEPDDESWNHTATGWPITPFGIRKVASWVSNEYKLPVYITENGYGGWSNDTIEDPIRVEFYKNYINNVLKAIRLDGADVRSYTAWSLIDNLEWANGYSIRFGVNHVNYTDPELKRTPKSSALYLKQLFADNGFIPPNDE